MKKGQDIVTKFSGLIIIHQKIPGRELGQHSHKEHEIFLPLQGEISISYNDKKITGSPGKMVYVSPNLEHSFSSSSIGEGERVICLIEAKTWSKYSKTRSLPKVIPLNSLLRELIFYLLLNPETKNAPTFIKAIVEVLGDQLDGDSEIGIGSLPHLSGKIKDARIQKALTLMQEEEALSLAELATKSGLSVRNFNRLFVEEVGMKPKQFSTSLKMEKAKEFLVKGQLTITDISLEVGYNSLSKFISAFQKYTGDLPSVYRNQARGLDN